MAGLGTAAYRLAARALRAVSDEAQARIDAFAAHVAAADPHGDRAYTVSYVSSVALSADRAFAARVGGKFFPSALTRYSADVLAMGTRNGSAGVDRLVATPLYAAEDLTLTDWQVQVQAAVPSSLYRLGVWTVDDQSRPFRWATGVQWATLLSDLGTVDCSTTGAKLIATPVTIPAGTWFAVGGVGQGAAPTLNIGNYIAGLFSPLGSLANVSTAPAAAQPVIGLAQNGVSGVLGSIIPTDGSQVGHGVGFRRSA